MDNDDNPHKNDYSEIEDITCSRREKMNTRLECLAYALSPRFHEYIFYDRIYLEKDAPWGIPRKPPNEDLEVMEWVMESLHQIADLDREHAILNLMRAQWNQLNGGSPMVPRPQIWQWGSESSFQTYQKFIRRETLEYLRIHPKTKEKQAECKNS
jgi:hypothetical protein